MNETITRPAAGLSESSNAPMSCGEAGAALTVPGAAAAPAQLRSPGQSGAPMPAPPAQDQARDMTGYWPLRDFLALGALPGAVPCARLHTRHILREWALTSLTDQTELVISELVTNAVRATRAMKSAAAVRVWLLSDKKTVTILVWDVSLQAPARTQADDDAEYGRGLLLVEAASANWGWYTPPGQAGKVVWALVQ